MNCIESQAILCPYCGERFEVTVDCTVDQQSYVEDCWVCCQPVLLTIQVDPALEIYAERENG